MTTSGEPTSITAFSRASFRAVWLVTSAEYLATDAEGVVEVMNEASLASLSNERANKTT